MTPSPQPLSPLNYNYPNTPSPYNMTLAGNAPLMSPNQQYRGTTGGGGAVGSIDRIPTPLEIHNEFNAYTGDHQQQQQQPQPHHSRHFVRQNQLSHQHESHPRPHQHQTQYPNLVYGNTDVTNWEEKYSNVLPNVTNTNAGAVAMNNLNPNEIQFNLQNLLMATASGTSDGTQLSHWNFPPTHEGAHLHHQHNLQAQQQQPTQSTFQEQHQQQQHQQPSSNDTTMTDVNRANIEVAADAEQGPTISTLMNFDSEQLVHINSEEQQMLRLTSEELRLSNLSISS
ncbi:unnamed protein product [Ceratitis capitata]|nr:unnamed protein product [Ceratitis capitata]